MLLDVPRHRGAERAIELTQPLVEACGEEGRDEFMLTVSPLPVKGGTGSPANPLAMF